MTALLAQLLPKEVTGSRHDEGGTRLKIQFSRLYARSTGFQSNKVMTVL